MKNLEALGCRMESVVINQNRKPGGLIEATTTWAGDPSALASAEAMGGKPSDDKVTITRTYVPGEEPKMPVQPTPVNTPDVEYVMAVQKVVRKDGSVRYTLFETQQPFPVYVR